MKRIIGFIRMKWEQFIIRQVEKFELQSIFWDNMLERELKIERENIELETKLFKLEDDYEKLYEHYKDLYLRYYNKTGEEL